MEFPFWSIFGSFDWCWGGLVCTSVWNDSVRRRGQQSVERGCSEASHWGRKRPICHDPFPASSSGQYCGLHYESSSIVGWTKNSIRVRLNYCTLQVLHYSRALANSSPSLWWQRDKTRKKDPKCSSIWTTEKKYEFDCSFFLDNYESKIQIIKSLWVTIQLFFFIFKCFWISIKKKLLVSWKV